MVGWAKSSGWGWGLRSRLWNRLSRDLFGGFSIGLRVGLVIGLRAGIAVSNELGGDDCFLFLLPFVDSGGGWLCPRCGDVNWFLKKIKKD